MFRGISDFFGRAVETVRDRISEFLGGGGDKPPPEAQPPEEIIQTVTDVDRGDSPEDTDPDDEFYDDDDDEITDTDPDDEFERYLDDLDDSIVFDRASQEVITLADYAGDPEDLRVIRYSTSQEAQEFLEQAGIDAFSEVIYLEDEDLFTIAVHDSPGAGE